MEKQGLEKKRLRIWIKRYLVKISDYSTKTTAVENKIPHVTGSVTIAALKTKRVEIENKIIDITNLSAKATLITKDK